MTRRRSHWRGTASTANSSISTTIHYRGRGAADILDKENRSTDKGNANVNFEEKMNSKKRAFTKQRGEKDQGVLSHLPAFSPSSTGSTSD